MDGDAHHTLTRVKSDGQTGNGQWQWAMAMGNGQWAMGNGQWAMEEDLAE
jgi:hypothetical protein